MKGVETYQDTSVTTQTKGRLVVMLYDGAIKFLKMAIKEIEAKNPEAKGKYIGKATDILFELNAVLDMEAGGEVATNLRKLYLFMGRHLTEANTKQDIGKIEEVIKLLEELNQSWKTIS
ncbi:MAG: flagellar export chaperone FliS [Planctomycetota bacterium]|jgi:flagellar protein FliS